MKECSKIVQVMATKKKNNIDSRLRGNDVRKRGNDGGDRSQRRSKSARGRYELLAIYPLGENEIAAEKGLAEMVTKNGFAITEVDKWGVKNLAYAIKKETKGYYLRFIIEKGDTKGLEKSLSFDDKILRYILVKI